MKKSLLLSFFLGGALLLSACSSVAVSEPIPESVTGSATEQTAISAPATEQGRDMMGRGMMARHHATIPDPYAGMTNPVMADDDSLARGGEIYATHCATCHGDGGMGDGPASVSLDPVPAAIAHTSQMLGDDYQFWRISEGGTMDPFNSGMIAWKGILDEQTRWDVINYVQALGKGTVMPGQRMGGMTFDPQVEAAKQAQMLADGVAQGVITQDEAAVFAVAHELVDGRMIQMRAAGAGGGMDEMLADSVAEMVAASDLTQEQADTFLSVHDRLGEAGLMQ